MSYTIDIYALDGTQKKAYACDPLFSPDALNEGLLHEYVVMYLANQRQNTAKAKSRGEVSVSNRKLFRQKGTGRARVGSADSPIRKKGGVAFGPLNTRNWTKKMNQKMKQKALLSAMVAKLQASDILGLEQLDYTQPKTKEAYTTLQALHLTDTKTLMVVDTHKETVYKSWRNIPHVSMTTLAHVNPYDLLTHKKVVFTVQALEQLQSRFHLLTHTA